MNKITKIFIAICALSTAVSCDALKVVSNNTVSSQGSPYELIIVNNQPQWDGAMGDTLRKIFRAEIPYLQQSEPTFSVFRVTESGYDNLILRHRNILRTVIDPGMTKTSAAVQYDVHASPQIVVTVQGGTDSTVTEYISTNRTKLVEIFEKAERDRATAYNQKFGVKSIESLINGKFDIEMAIPEGYTLRNEMDNFVWASYEYPTASQGLFIYKYPVSDGEKALSIRRLTDARNKYAALIPGPVEGSYMTTVAEYEPDQKVYDIDGRMWVELRGFWDVENDFMGGPFVSYSTLDGEDVLTIDMYVYSPKLDKRNFIKGLEHLIYGVKVD